MSQAQQAEPSRLLILLAYGAIYLLWGTTYLAIRYAVEDLPPFWVAGTRSVTAGLILLAAQAIAAPSSFRKADWRTAWIAGGLFFLGCHGLLSLAQQWADSGIAALVLATTPLWMVILERLTGGPAVGWKTWTGLLTGLLGVALLASVNLRHSAVRIPPLALLTLLASGWSWALGSLYVRRAAVPSNAGLSSGLQLVCGGALLFLVSASLGEFQQLDGNNLKGPAGLALLYLIVGGSLAGFSAYNWLLHVTPNPAKVGSYAFVNPALALLLGWLIASEPFSWFSLASSGLILAGVALIHSATGRRAGGWRLEGRIRSQNPEHSLDLQPPASQNRGEVKCKKPSATPENTSKVLCRS